MDYLLHGILQVWASFTPVHHPIDSLENGNQVNIHCRKARSRWMWVAVQDEIALRLPAHIQQPATRLRAENQSQERPSENICAVYTCMSRSRQGLLIN